MIRTLTRLLQPGTALVPAARVVCIASGKGGVGKSVLATNLALARARAGERVLLVDFDAGLANAHLLLGLAPRHDLGSILDGTVDAREALVEGPGGLRLLSGGVGKHSLVSPTRRELDRMFQALIPLEASFDLVVVDHGAGLSYGTVAHLAATRALLLVTSHEVTALSDAYAVYKRSRMVNPEARVGVVVNRVPDEATARGAFDRLAGVATRFLSSAPELAGWVPQDEAVARSVERRAPVLLEEPSSPSARALSLVSAWPPIDRARTTTAFYERARRALS